MLDAKQQHIALLGCFAAKGDLGRLEREADEALSDGLSLAELKEVMCQMYAYAGFPRALNALGVLQRLVERRKREGRPYAEGREASALPADYDALRCGTEVQTRLVGQPFDYAFAPAIDFYLKAHLFGDIFVRDLLGYADRELATVGALCGLEGVMPQLSSHVAGAVNMGCTREQLAQVADLLEQHVGSAEALRMRKAYAAAFGLPTDERALAVQHHVGIADSPYPIGLPNTGYARYFTGQSYLAPMEAEKGGVVNVSFEPGCRNFWHAHQKQVQVLVCVAGRGFYQEWGGEARELVPGVVVAIPEGVKHWHGAAPDSWMQHLTYHTLVQEGAATEWLEEVSEADYRKACAQ